MLSNQPQGGFITRKVTPPGDLIASDNGWGDNGFPFFQRNWNSQTDDTRRRGDYYPGQWFRW